MAGNKAAAEVGVGKIVTAAEVAVAAVETRVELAVGPSLDLAAEVAPEAAVDLDRLDTLLSLFYTSLMLLSLLLTATKRFNLTS